MKSGSHYAIKQCFALMLIGTPKSGKTCFAMSFPRPYILDCDNNLGGALRYHKYAEHPFDYFFDNPQEDVDEVGKRWAYCMNALKAACESPDVDSIIVDGLSLLAEYLIAKISPHSKLVVAGEQVMSIESWQPFKNLMSQLIMRCKASGKYFIMTCHEQAMTDDKGAVVAYRPLIQSALRDNICGLFSDVWRCEASAGPKGANYSVRFAPRNLMQIGNSLQFDTPTLDVTGKTRDQIWQALRPKLELVFKQPDSQLRNES